jgi:hypothetical protein
MQAVTTIGLDIAKSVFQVHGVDAAGQVLIRRQLKRRAVLAFFQKLPPCLIGNREPFRFWTHSRHGGIARQSWCSDVPRLRRLRGACPPAP